MRCDNEIYPNSLQPSCCLDTDLQDDVIEADEVLRPGSSLVLVIFGFLQFRLQSVSHALVPLHQRAQLDVGQVTETGHLLLLTHLETSSNIPCDGRPEEPSRPTSGVMSVNWCQSDKLHSHSVLLLILSFVLNLELKHTGSILNQNHGDLKLESSCEVIRNQLQQCPTRHFQPSPALKHQ